MPKNFNPPNTTLPNNTTHPSFIPEKRLASWLGVSVRKLQHDRQKNRGIPFHKIGRSVRYSVHDIETFLNNNHIETGEV